MPNYCDYEMRIRSSDKNVIKNVLECLRTDYNYGEGKPAHKHLWRVFQADADELQESKDGTFIQHIVGNCAWSKSFRVDNPYRLPVAYVLFRKGELNPAIPDLAIPCGGHCPECLACWSLEKGQSVYFRQH